jgi:hypothetical protein
MFRNQNANQFAEQITQLRARSRLHKDKDLMAQVKPLDETYAANLKTDPTQALTALTASLDNLMITASSPAMQSAAAGINWIAEALQTAANFGKEHPVLAMGGGLGAGGAAMAGAGFLPWKLMTGFGLSTSATALDAAAAALSSAAVELGGAGVASKAAGAAGVFGSLPVPAAIAAATIVPALVAYQNYRDNQAHPGRSATDVLENQGDGEMAWAASYAASHNMTGEVTGSVKVDVEVTDKRVNVTTSDDVAKLSGRLNLNGPGSAGKSSPDAMPGWDSPL